MFNLSVFDLWGICQLCKHFYLRGGAKKFKVGGVRKHEDSAEDTL